MSPTFNARMLASLNGGVGNDTLDGGTGNDTMTGGAGIDTYVVREASDVVNENLNEGTDLVQTYVTLSALAANVENVTIMGTTALNAAGNALDNVLTGNGGADTRCQRFVPEPVGEPC